MPLIGYCCLAQDCERQNALPKATQIVAESRFEPRLSLGLAVFDLFNGQAGNTVDKGNFSKIKKWNVSAQNSFPAPNTACSVLSRRIRRALCNPRKAERQRQGLPLSFCCLLVQLAPPRSPSQPVPTKAILGQKSQNKAHIFLPKWRGHCWRNNGLAADQRSWAQAGDKSLA